MSLAIESSVSKLGGLAAGAPGLAPLAGRGGRRQGGLTAAGVRERDLAAGTAERRRQAAALLGKRGVLGGPEQHVAGAAGDQAEREEDRGRKGRDHREAEHHHGADHQGLGWASSWPPMSAPRLSLSSVATRVTMMPAVIEMSSAGICETRPSPMVRIE